MWVNTTCAPATGVGAPPATTRKTVPETFAVPSSVTFTSAVAPGGRDGAGAVAEQQPGRRVDDDLADGDARHR